MDTELREFERRLVRSGQDVRVVPGKVARKTLDYIEQELRRQRVIRQYFTVTADSSEIEQRDRLITELEEIIDDWNEHE